MDTIPWLLQSAWASFTRHPRRLPLSAFFLSKKEKKNTGRLPLSLQCFSISAPKEPILSFSVTATRLRLLLASDKVKQPALCYQEKGHLLKVSGLEGFWASKSQSLFSTHHFYRIGWKSDIQILQREKERGRAAAIPVQAALQLLLGHFYNSSSYLWVSVFYAAHWIKKKGACPYGTMQEQPFNEHQYLISMLNLVKSVLILNTVKSRLMWGFQTLDACKSTFPPSC